MSVAVMALLMVAWPFGADAHPYADGIPPGARAVGQRYRAADGALLTEAEAEARAPDTVRPEGMGEWLGGEFELVTLAVIPAQLGEVELRESAGLLVASLAVFASAVVITERRRPT
ncbi:MAG: hypothetical protein U0869_10510 [Chloroflexota bacterium]